MCEETQKVHGLLRPEELIMTEKREYTQYYICPSCHKIYKAKISRTTTYEDVIDRSQEGVVVTSNYWCKDCHDYAFEVDTLIANSVKMLLDNGINTVSSCSGHPEIFGDTDFVMESMHCFSGAGEEDPDLYYGNCIAIYLDDDTDKNLLDAFSELREKYEHHDRIFVIPPDEYSPNWFLMVKVNMSIERYRKSSKAVREIALEKINQEMEHLCSELVHLYATKKAVFGSDNH